MVIETFFEEVLAFVSLSTAAMLFIRIGIRNIAIEGQIILCGCVYASSLQHTSGYMALLTTLFVGYVVSFFIVYFCAIKKLDDLLTSVGIFFVCLGAAPILASVISSSPLRVVIADSGFLTSDMLIWNALAIAVIIPLVTWVWAFRRLKILAFEASSLWRRVTHLSSGLAIYVLLPSILIVLPSVIFVELGGAYADRISQDRGLIALAIAAVVGGRLLAGVALSSIVGLMTAIAIEMPGEGHLSFIAGGEHVLVLALFLFVVGIYGVFVAARKS